MLTIWNPKVLKLDIFLRAISSLQRQFVIFCNQTSFLFVNKDVSENSPIVLPFNLQL